MRFSVKRHAVTQPLDTSYRLIPLTQGQTAIVDAADYDWLNQWLWCAEWVKGTKSFRAARKMDGKHLLMHRLILGCKPTECCDHKNHDTLDNRRKNLRKCTSAENLMNRRPISACGFKGVYRRNSGWEATICNGILVGHYKTAQEAALAYDKAAKEKYGEFAFLNFPDGKGEG